MTDYAGFLYAFFQSKGASIYATSGALGNIQTETGGTFDPTSFNSREQAIGFCQWENAGSSDGRRAHLQAYAATRGTTETDAQTQADFMWHELTTSYSDVYAQWVIATSAESAALIWASGYERSASSNWGERQTNAANIYAQIKAGHVPTGGGTPSATTTAPTPFTKGAPFDPDTLTAPLTADQRATIIAYLHTLAGKGLSGVPTASKLNAMSDKNLIAFYKTAVAISGAASAATAPQDWLTELGAILGWISRPANWERIGLFALGGIIIFVVADKFLGDEGISVPTPPKVIPV